MSGHTLTGEFRSFPAFESKFLADQRDVLVHLPPDYDSDTTRRYPVLYLQDGQNLFDGATSYIQGQEWCVDETADQLVRACEIEPLIIVGIYNAGERRIDEYTPTRDPNRQRGGSAHLYAAMLRYELKPMIDREFRTLRGPEHTGLGGSSLGGLLTLILGLQFPETFGKLAVISPSLWWDNEFPIRRARALRAKLPLHIWLDMGTEEGADCVRLARELRDILEAKGWAEGVDLQHWEAAGANHSESSWSRRVAPVLKFLFPLVPTEAASRSSLYAPEPSSSCHPT